MEKLSFEFLSTLAQVSATFMGFALLTSVFQAIGSTLKGGEYINTKNLFMKLVTIALFPITVLAYPFLFSLYLLLLNKDVTKPHCLLLNVTTGLLYLCYFLKIQKYSKLRGEKEDYKLRIFKLFLFFVTWIPIVSFLLPIILLLFIFFKLISSPIFSSYLFLLVVSGFLLVLRNLGIKFDEGVLFDLSKDFKKDDKGDKIIRKVLTEFKVKVEKAISEREELINKMMERIKSLKSKKDKEEFLRSIAEQHSEIELFRDFINGEFFEKNKNIVKKIENKQGYITLRELSDLISWLEKAEAVYWEFQRGTKRSKIIFTFYARKQS